MSYIHKAKIMYANEDIYSGPNDPTNNINPKIIGAFYINTKTANLFVCTNNTINKNVWKLANDYKKELKDYIDTEINPINQKISNLKVYGESITVNGSQIGNSFQNGNIRVGIWYTDNNYLTFIAFDSTDHYQEPCISVKTNTGLTFDVTGYPSEGQSMLVPPNWSWRLWSGSLGANIPLGAVTVIKFSIK